jgi:tetratricopeptide (TPR) repeat protein
LSTEPRTRPESELLEERDHLLASIDDLDREHSAGEMDDADYEALRGGYVARAAAVLREIDAPAVAAAAAAPSGDRSVAGRSRLRRLLGRRRSRVVLSAVLAVCVTGLLALLALRIAGVRLPGETVTGSVTLNSKQQLQQELTQAQQLGSQGDVKDALTLYQQILAAYPNQPQALAYRGWLLRLTGLEQPSKSAGEELVKAGRASIEQAIKASPTYGDAHLLLGLSLLEDSGDLAGAVGEFRAALADHVTAPLLQATRPVLVKAFAEDHQPAPSALAPPSS